MFTEGMEVVVYPRDRDGQYLLTFDTVARVSKTRVILSSGAQYSLRGTEWGAGEAWHPGYIQPATPDVRTRAERNNAATIERIRKIKLETQLRDEVKPLTSAQIQAVLDFIATL